MKPKLQKKLGGGLVEATVKTCKTFKELDEVVNLFNNNYTIKTCSDYYENWCFQDDSSDSLITFERMGPLGCGYQKNPK
jgi:hypothetical protein